MKIHYLEIVSDDVDGVCKAYEATHDITFGAEDEMLGGARTASLSDGGSIGVRPSLSETEAPIVRPYWLVDDIEQAVEKLEGKGAKIAIGPLEIPGKGIFAIYILGSNDHGLWQV